MGLRRLLIVLVAWLPALASAAVDFKVLTDLDRFEPFDAHAFHDGKLWVGKSRSGLGADYRLEVFDSAGKKLGETKLQHSLRFLYPYGKSSVLTVGVSAATQLTHFTIATFNGSQFQIQSAQIPLGAYANEWAGVPGNLFFTDPGGQDDGSPIGVPLKTLFSFRSGSFRYLAPRIRGARSPKLVGNSLYVVEHPSIESGGRTLFRVNLGNESNTAVASGTDIINVALLADGKTLALSDRGASEIVLVDAEQGKEIRRLKVAAGAPRGVAEEGKCLVVASEQTKKISFLDKTSGALVAEWDASVVGNKLFGLRNIAADAATGRVYVRSAYAANPLDPGPEERNSVVLFEETDGATFKACATADGSNAGSWMKQLAGMGVGSSRNVAVRSAQANLDLDVEDHRDLCARHGGQYSVDQHPEARCEQFYPVMNWRCSVTAKVVCRFK